MERVDFILRMQQKHIKVNKGGTGHLGWSQPQELQPLRETRAGAKAGFIFIDQNKCYIPKTVHKEKLENVLK